MPTEKERFEILLEDVSKKFDLLAEGQESICKGIQDFRKENEDVHEEIKSMIKFSYATLDNRITTLETQLETFEKRITQLEASH